MANVLCRQRQIDVLRLLVEGNSIRGTERITGVHRDTICRLVVRFGDGCRDFLDQRMQRLTLDHVQLFAYYNFCWRTRYPDNSGKPGKKRPTAAMMAGITDRLWKFEDLFSAVA